MEFNREEEAKKSMAEAEERFKSDDLLAAIQLAKKAQSLYPSLPHLSNFIVALRILSTAASPTHRSNDSFHHAILSTKPTDTIEAIKHKYRKLCIQTHPDKNPTPAADPAFKLVHQAWDALNSKPKIDATENKPKANNTADSTEYRTNLKEAKKAMAEAEERFKANQLLEAIILAQKAKTLYPFLPHLDGFIVALRVVLIADRMPRNDPLWHAVLGSNSTDCFGVVKNKYRELCELTNPDRNLNAAAEAAFRLVNQAWDALKDRVQFTTVNAYYVSRHPYGILPPPPAPLSAFLRMGTRAGADGRTRMYRTQAPPPGSDAALPCNLLGRPTRIYT